MLKGLLLAGVSGWIWCEDVRVLGDKKGAVVVLMGPQTSIKQNTSGLCIIGYVDGGRFQCKKDLKQNIDIFGSRLLIGVYSNSPHLTLRSFKYHARKNWIQRSAELVNQVRVADCYKYTVHTSKCSGLNEIVILEKYLEPVLLQNGTRFPISLKHGQFKTHDPKQRHQNLRNKLSNRLTKSRSLTLE